MALQLLRPNTSPFQLFAGACRRAADAVTTLTFPTDRWRDDIYGFAEEVFGITEYSDGQREMIDSFLRNRNTTVRSGHKCGKTFVLALLALWVWCTFPEARSVLSAATEYQADTVDFGQVQRLYRIAANRGYPLGGTLYESPRKGLIAVDPDGSTRRLWCVIARSPEAAAGISGPCVALFGDEVSGQTDEFLTAIGTSLGGANVFARVFWISNPTQTSGKFYDSHFEAKGVWHKIHLSSLDAAKFKIPGLATLDWLNERAQDWGVDSAEWKVRIAGEFPIGQEGKVISVHLIGEGQQAWNVQPYEGRLVLGLDPASDSENSDMTALAVRRGMLVKRVLGRANIDEFQIADWICDTIKEERTAKERMPLVVVDASGPVGARTITELERRLSKSPTTFEIVEVRSDKIAYGNRDCHSIRSALWLSMREFLRAGGGIPDDQRLSTELNVAEFSEKVAGKDGKARNEVQSKKEMRRLLKRSPDYADACNLAVWGWDGGQAEEAIVDVPRAQAVATRIDDDDVCSPQHGLDPYSRWGAA
ncbi:MAG: hypothetical protein E6R03_12975 [Hyphomicrobiaceae bacterium]|nr:MAG: hypothetical protein E6R03_12975 [Hyphomicrobiaceae bacterium]